MITAEVSYDVVVARQQYLRREAERCRPAKQNQQAFEDERRERHAGRALAGYLYAQPSHVGA